MLFLGGSMGVVWTEAGLFRRAEYEGEADLEKAVLRIQHDLFGPDRIYIDVKKKIGAKGGIQNIPDGYLLDLTGPQPRLFVVENELAAHDPLRHIAVQILQFSLSFESEPLAVKKVLLTAVHSDPKIQKECEGYVAKHGFRNLDHLFEHLVVSSFAALVIIDEMPEHLENVLSQKFKFGVEVLEVGRYVNAAGEYAYRFEPFLADLAEDTESPIASTPKSAPSLELDTVVVPARAEGVEEVFLKQNRWYAVRIHGTMKPQIKYIALYQVAPVSAITHIAPVKSIEPWQNSNKVVVNFAEPAKAIGPLQLVKNGKVKALQSIRYTTRERLLNAKTLDDVWAHPPILLKGID
jgi:hypothetical protein